MSGGMPELGSKISLISKADIRYEGRLYTVDPQECTIALSSVRSFGTEDRETQYQIAPQTQIYDYILFRGSDIKDIRVVNNSLPHPNDPAIMQVQLPNGQHLMPHFPMPNMNPPPPMGGGAFSNPFGMGPLAGLGGASGGPSLAPGTGAPGPFMLGNQQQQQPQQQQQKSQQQQQQQQKQPNMLAGGSRSTTPISLSRKSPSADMGVQVNPQGNQHQAGGSQQHQSNAGHGGNNARDAGQKRQNHQGRGGNNQRNNNNGNNDYYNQQQRDRRDSGRNMDNYNNQQHDARNNYNNQRNQNRAWTMHRGGPNNPNNMMMRNRGGGGRGRMPNQGYRPMGGPGGSQNKPRNGKNTIKFEQDFDFEQANNKFEELRSQLSKLKVGDDPKSEQMNGETDKKDDSGNETGAGEHEPEDEEITVGYDKTKSFFDNISCEAAQDRSKNKKNDWRQERKLNSETFGVSSTRRGGYRGRANYYNRIGNYAGGGGYNRNYRGGNYRNRSNNRMGGGDRNINGTPNGNNTNNGTAAPLKNQTQQQQAQTPAGAAAAATTGGGGTPSGGAGAKSMLQESNAQPQVVAVGQ